MIYTQKTKLSLHFSSHILLTLACYVSTRISGPYGRFILAPAEGLWSYFAGPTEGTLLTTLRKTQLFQHNIVYLIL